VHADSITAAILHGAAHDAEVVCLPGDLQPVRRLFCRLARLGTPRACYEASGAGFVLQRVLTKDGYHCEVIAPSLIPRKPGDRRKTDRLDAIMLAKLYRSGHLTAIHVPSPHQEALRRLLRLRCTYQLYCKATKHRIGGMLRNHPFMAPFYPRVSINYVLDRVPPLLTSNTQGYFIGRVP
jgi:transposase